MERPAQHVLGPLRAAGPAARRPGPERRDAVDHRCLVLVGAGHQRGADRRATGQRHAARGPLPIEIDVAPAAGQLDPVGQPAVELAVEVRGPGADAPADPLGLQVAGPPGVERGRDVGVGPLDGADHRPVAVAALDPGGQLAGDVGPEVGVVDLRPDGDPGAVDGKGHQRGQWCGAAVGGLGVDPQQVEPGVDGEVGALAPGPTVGQPGVADVGVERPVAGQAPHLGRAGRQAGRAAGRHRRVHRSGHAGGEELGPGGVEPGAVGGESVVEVGAQELAGPAVGVSGADVQPGGGHVGRAGDRPGDEPVHDRRSAEQVGLHQRHRARARPQVQHAGPQPGPEPGAGVRVAGVAGLGQSRRRGDVDLGGPGQQPAGDRRRYRGGGQRQLEARPAPSAPARGRSGLSASMSQRVVMARPR